MKDTGEFLSKSKETNAKKLSFLSGCGLSEYEKVCSTYREEDINASVKIIFDRLEESLENAIKVNSDETFYRDEDLATSPLDFIDSSLYFDAHIHRYLTIPSVFLDPSRNADSIAKCAINIYPELAISMAKELLSSGKINFVGIDKKSDINITDNVKVVAIATDLLSIDMKKNFISYSLKYLDNISSSDDKSLGEQVVFAIKNNFDKNSIAEIKDGKSAQLMEILRGFITTSTYSHNNNTFDLFNSIDKMNDISICNYMGTAQNNFNNISFEIKQKNNKGNNYDPAEPSM